MPMPRRKHVLFAAAVLAIAGLIGIYTILRTMQPNPGVGYGEARVGGPFRLTDHAGKTVTDKDFEGRYLLVFFGDTRCGDICASQLQVMVAALAELGTAQDRIQPLFITLDPDRDGPSDLRTYLETFSPQIIGLTGHREDIAAVTRAYAFPYSGSQADRVSGGAGKYPIMLYLMDPNGRYLTHFSYTTDASGLAKGLTDAMAASP
jgi:protein SCO1/2